MTCPFAVCFMEIVTPKCEVSSRLTPGTFIVISKDAYIFFKATTIRCRRCGVVELSWLLSPA